MVTLSKQLTARPKSQNQYYEQSEPSTQPAQQLTRLDVEYGRVADRFYMNFEVGRQPAD